MRRRELVAGLASAVAWSATASAQQRDSVRRVGFFSGSGSQNRVWLDAFKRRLAELGWVEGRNVRIDVRHYDSNPERVRASAIELVASALEVIVSTSPALRPLHELTRAIPVVFVLALDPVAEGFASSLARPGGNMAGFDPAFAGKYLQLIKDAAPRIRRVSFIYDPIITGITRMAAGAAAAAPQLGLDYTATPVRNSAEIEQAITDFAREPNGAMWVPSNTAINLNLELVVALTRRYHIPTIGVFRFFAIRGGLMSYGPDDVDMFRGAASYVDRILRGEKPAELPVQYPAKYQFVINRTAARAINLELQPSLLSIADELIE